MPERRMPIGRYAVPRTPFEAAGAAVIDPWQN